MSTDTQYITLAADDIMRVGETDYRVERHVTNEQEPTP